MMNWFLIVFLFSFTTKMFLFSFDDGTVQRAFTHLDYTVYQKDVISRYWDDKAIYGEVLPPYFSPDAVKETTKQYFEENLARIQTRITTSDAYEFGQEIVTTKGVFTNRYQQFTLHWECRFQSVYCYRNEKTFTIVKGK